MNETIVTIKEENGKYQIENNGLSELALLGLLECVVFDLKQVNRRRETSIKAEPADNQKEDESRQPQTIPAAQEAAAPLGENAVAESNLNELRTRIGNALKAIKALGGETTPFDSENATEERLQAEIEALTDQYKRLKSSKGK